MLGPSGLDSSKDHERPDAWVSEGHWSPTRAEGPDSYDPEGVAMQMWLLKPPSPGASLLSLPFWPQDAVEERLDRKLWPFVSDPAPTPSSQAAVR